MSIKRVIVAGALLVWTVLKTKCPVRAACIAIWAVSKSRISPINTISGSWRTIDLNALAKVSPIFSFTCTWFTPLIVYSTGSSTVIILTSTWFSLFKIAYKVVVLPEPVGPLIKIIPLGLFIVFVTIS